MPDYIQAAFRSVCAAPPLPECRGARRYVSLYRQERFYGGPEEGGWWGTDWVRIETREYMTAAAARAAAAAAERLAAQLSREAVAAHSARCDAECDWLDSRGLDSDTLPEPDGPDAFTIMVERSPGWFESRGPRHYE
jgi:hypothetical protein